MTLNKFDQLAKPNETNRPLTAVDSGHDTSTWSIGVELNLIQSCYGEC